MKRNCDNCYHFIMKSGIMPTLVCLEEEDKPETIREYRKFNGRTCPYWHPKPRIIDNAIRSRRF